jgi:glycosyltransferase involved in cell wall biosynthesis
MKKMNFNFISYLNPFKYSGGGETVNKKLLEYGTRRGHTFNFTSAKNRIHNYKPEADMDILVDVFNFPHTLKSGGNWISLEKSFIQRVVQTRPFVHLSHAYVDVCNLGYLPCSGVAENPCPSKSSFSLSGSMIRQEFSKSCFAQYDLVQDLFKNSLANIFVSPLHREITEKVLGFPLFESSIILKPIISTSDFVNKNQTRDIEYLFVGVISEAKGISNLRNGFRDKNIVLAGKIHPSTTLDFGTYIGEVPYSEMPSLMNRAVNFVYLPRWPEPQGRVVIEAALSGCNLITNENVGATSFPFDIADPNNLQKAEEEFWTSLEGVCDASTKG